MPASLLESQFATLEPLAPDERGLVIDVDQDIDASVERYVSTLARSTTPNPNTTPTTTEEL